MYIRKQIALFFLATAAVSQSGHHVSRDDKIHYPRLIHAELPLYPPLAWTAHIEGTVSIQVRVERGSVVDAQITASNNPLLSNPAMTNVQTWQFESEDSAVFTVSYVYEIKGKQTPLPENPKVELNLPLLVKITACPFKPTSDP